MKSFSKSSIYGLLGILFSASILSPKVGFCEPKNQCPSVLGEILKITRLDLEVLLSDSENFYEGSQNLTLAHSLIQKLPLKTISRLKPRQRAYLQNLIISASIDFIFIKNKKNPEKFFSFVWDKATTRRMSWRVNDFEKIYSKSGGGIFPDAEAFWEVLLQSALKENLKIDVLSMNFFEKGNLTPTPESLNNLFRFEILRRSFPFRGIHNWSWWAKVGLHEGVSPSPWSQAEFMRITGTSAYNPLTGKAKHKRLWNSFKDFLSDLANFNEETERSRLDLDFDP